MSDHFADRYWSTRFWAVRYFQGGEENPGAMSASLSGSGALSATATFVQVSVAARGDDGGYARHTGDARRSIYAKQIDEFVEQIKAAPKGKKKAKAKRLAEKLKKIEPALPQQVFAKVDSLIDKLADNKITYKKFEQAALAQLEQAKARHRRNRSIAIAMLMAA